MRFLFYSHDGLGLGHTRRHLAVARALTQANPDASVLLASGAEEVTRLGLAPRIDVLKLPGLRKVQNEQYASRWLDIPIADIRALRSDLLRTAVKTFRPDVVLVDKHPLGAKGEFRAALDELRETGGCAVLGLRDILDDPAAVRREWAAYRMQERIEEYFDLVLVYGERSVFDPITEYQFLPAVAERTRFCGYVVNHDTAEAQMDITWVPPGLKERTRPLVLATAGGGEDGFRLMETFLRACQGAPWNAIAVTGPMVPHQDLVVLQGLAAEAGVHLHPFVPHLPALFWSADALVCMGGYNTLVEAASTGLPIVCVPRTAPRAEQVIRARAFVELGLASMIAPAELDCDALRDAIRSALQRSRQRQLDNVHDALEFDGARTAARHLLELAGQRCFAGPTEFGRAPRPVS
jgi:predicted glycosyltransferase